MRTSIHPSTRSIILMMLVPWIVFGSARLIWDDPNPPGTVGKFVVYHATALPAIEVSPWWMMFDPMGETTTNAFDLGRLHSGNHFFIVTAVGTNAFESDPSNQVLAPVVNPPQGTKIVITIP